MSAFCTDGAAASITNARATAQILMSGETLMPGKPGFDSLSLARYYRAILQLTVAPNLTNQTTVFSWILRVPILSFETLWTMWHPLGPYLETHLAV